MVKCDLSPLFSRLSSYLCRTILYRKFGGILCMVEGDVLAVSVRLVQRLRRMSR